MAARTSLGDPQPREPQGQPRAKIRPLTSRAQQQLQRFQNRLQTTCLHKSARRSRRRLRSRHDWSGSSAPETRSDALLDQRDRHVECGGRCARGRGRGLLCRERPFPVTAFCDLLYFSEHDEKQNTVSCVVLSEDINSISRTHIGHQPVNPGSWEI